MATKQMAFMLEAVGGNNTTLKTFAIVPGKEPVVTVVRGRVNQISIRLTVTHTDIFGPEPPDIVVAQLGVEKGWPYKTFYDFDWDVEVDGDEISILGDPKETAVVKKARENVKTDYKAKGGSKYLEIHAKSIYVPKGLKLDAPWVEGEGDLFSLQGDSMESKPVKFLCKLEAEPAAKKTWPKLPDSLVTAKAYFEAKNADTLPTQSVKDVEAWVKAIKDFGEGALYRAIRDKQVTIFLDGYTSKSGYKDYNKKLAESRIGAVDRILKKSTNLGSGIDVIHSPKQQSKFEEKHDYRVEMYFEKVKAETAMKASEP